MEIALVHKTDLRVKGKSATFIVNPTSTPVANAALLLNDSSDQFGADDIVIIHGPGDYEVGGVKITGFKHEKGVVYSMNVDNITIVLGKIETLSAMQHKLKEHNVVVALCTEGANAAFLTSLAENAIIVYGEKAAETAQGFEKEKLKTLNKYVGAAGKLSAELETILLNA